MTEMRSGAKRNFWALMLSASAILAITMGGRQSLGLFVAPLTQATGLGIASISFALAVGQLLWGVVQPLFGAVADKKGAYGVIAVGAVLLALGLGLAPFAESQWSLIVTLGLLSAAGAGAGSFSVLMGATAQQISPERRSFAGGFINAGGSLGQFIYAPLVQLFISAFGWMAAMFSMAVSMLVTIPLGLVLRGKKTLPEAAGQADKHKAAAEALPQKGLKTQLKEALRDRSYLCLHAGFFTCGFHVAFLVTHLPGEVALAGHHAYVSAASLSIIGLFNVAGSLAAGYLGTKFRMKYILAVMYASRAVMITAFLLAPKTAMTFYIFAAALGFTWLATVPPTAGLVGKLFGTTYLSTLIGLTLFTHQVGGFLGAWLGGLAMAHDGNYLWMWYADIVLALLAALINLPIREKPVGAVE